MINEQLKTDLIKAQKMRNIKRVDTLRLLIAEVNNAEIALRGQGKVINDDEILNVLTKEAKKRNESIEVYEKAGRNELVEDESAELRIIQEYLPKQMQEDEIKKVIQDIMVSMDGDKSTDFGLVMQKVMLRLKGRADGKIVSKIVKDRLTA